jgi:glycosyltransferase involved in cell wall biosynthesis
VSDQSLVSVIINCFNGDKYLHKALNSVVAQTYKNWEIIFWDNQSVDKSAEIFKSYKDARFKYYYAPEHSKILYEARNYAIAKANGDFFAFLDVDDWWLPNKLEKQIPLFSDPKVGVVYGNFLNFYEKQNKTKIYKKKTLPTGMVLRDLLRDYPIGSPTYVIRKKSMEKLNYHFNNHFHIIGEFDLILRLSVYWKLDCVQGPVAYARIHGKNIKYLYRNLEIDEMKIWYAEMKKNPIFSSLNELGQIKKYYMYLETMETILKDRFSKSFFQVAKYPFSLKKLKLIIALLLPKFALKRIKTY